jgi:ABC-2 type transport system ATP-binding protein
VISVQNVSKDYGSHRVLHQVSFDVKKGEVLGLLGPNGAGKTTMMRILTGFFRPTEGRVFLDGFDLSKDPKRLKRRIGYLPERVTLYPDLRVEELLKFVAQIRRVPRKKVKAEIDEKTARCGIESVRRRLIGHLSKGFLQRVGLAQALIGNPDVLVLDEPTASLDPKQIIEIRELIRELGRERTLVLSTHILPEVHLVCERVLILNQGRIVAQGKTAELEQGLRERHEIVVRVGRSGAPGEGEKLASLEVLLGSIPGVESVARTSEEDSAVTYLLQALPDEELRPEIARRVVETGLPLLEFQTKRLSLEDIFLKLVVSEEMAGSER